MGARGPKPDLPSEDDRSKVQVMSACGLTQKEIGLVMGKSVDWLHKYCAEEFANGRATVKAKVGGSIISQALKGNMTAAIFYAKTQMGWKERAIVEHHQFDLSKLSDQELEDVERARRLLTTARIDYRGEDATEH